MKSKQLNILGSCVALFGAALLVWELTGSQCEMHKLHISIFTGIFGVGLFIMVPSIMKDAVNTVVTIIPIGRRVSDSKIVVQSQATKVEVKPEEPKSPLGGE